MKVNIRQESPADYKDIFKLVEAAFKNEEYSDHSEQFLVERLRKSTAFIPELSLVAEVDSKIVGHILLTKIKILGEDKTHDSLALAPVTVTPARQNRGFGGKLIQPAHKKAQKLGYQSIILLGHQDYYPRFGYERASNFGITLPFEAPAENCMAIELVKGGLNGVSGIVEYPAAFFE